MTTFRYEGLMKFGELALAAMAILVLTACSEKSEKAAPRQSEVDTDKALCVGSVREKLINPETMQLFDFKRLQSSDAGFDSKDNPLENLGVTRLRQYYFRYKADSQVGLKVTSQNLCYINQPRDKKVYCGCLDWNLALAAGR